MKLWLNGAIMEAGSARIDPADRGFTLGDGVFETIRVKNHRPLRASQHFERLFAGAAFLQIPMAWREVEIEAAITEVLRMNGLHEAALRITLSRGPAARGVKPQNADAPTLLITCAPLPPPRPPAAAIISRVTCRNAGSPLSRIKSLNYLDSIIALQEAERRGADEAILCNGKGQIAEASAANIFLICDDKLITPPVADGALPGIMRAALIAQFGALEASLKVRDIQNADAALLSNALGLRAIASIDETSLDVQHPQLRAMMAWVEAEDE